MKDPAGDAAAAHYQHDLGIGGLVIHPFDFLCHVAGDGTGKGDDIGMTGRSHEFDPEALNIISRGQGGNNFDIAAVAGAAVDVKHP